MQQKQQTSLAQNDLLTRMLERYPLISQRKEAVPSLKDAIIAENLSLSAIDAKSKSEITNLWLRTQLVDVLRFCGAYDVASKMQVIIIARQIRSKYFYFTPTELTFFFESFIGGAYGVLYVGKSFNPQVIMQAVRIFDGEVINKRAEIEDEYYNKCLQEEQKLIKEGETGINAWLKYCEENELDNQPLPMQQYLKESRKRKFNVK